MPGDNPRPFFSVILPVYNGERYIRQTIETVLKQSDPDWELIIVDDVSNDATPGIIREYTERDARIRSIRNEININCGPSANRGIEIARGVWIARIDADDWYHAEYLAEIHARVKDRWREDIFLSAWVAIMDENGRKILDMTLPDAKTSARMMPYENFLFHPATSYPKHLWKKVGGYPPVQPDLKLVGGDDWILWKKFLKSGARLEMIPKFLVDYRIHQANMSLGAGFAGAEWIVSLLLKQNRRREAREAIRKSFEEGRRKSFKGLLYYYLSFMPAPVVRFFMWRVRAYTWFYFHQRGIERKEKLKSQNKPKP